MKNNKLILYLVILIALITMPKLLLCQDSLYVYPSASEVEVEVINITIKMEGRYKYIYTVESLQESIQDIWFFNIENNAKIYSYQSPENWWSGYRNKQINILPVWAWSSAKNMIKPGILLDGFEFLSFGLPKILKYFIVGYVDPPEFDDEPMADQLIGATFVENSFQGYTLSPSDPPEPLIPSEFLDTLINYTEQSFELGWITDQTTRDKYLNYFNTAKSYLEIADTNSARNELLKVLTDVDIDSSTTLSSEAYALIKFNTEYLIERL